MTTRLLFGGTFDPVHHGHLILARAAMERLQAASVTFLPAAISPHKLHYAPVPAALRLEMLQAALADEPGFHLDDRELHRAGPSYTFDTVAEIQAEDPTARLLCLVGADHHAALETWHRIGELRQLVEFVFLQRGPVAGGDESGLRRMDISSTEIRERIARGLSIRYLVPESVRAIIESHCLYCHRFPPF